MESQRGVTTQQQVFENIPLRTVESQWEALYLQFDINNDGRIPVSYLSRELSEHNRGVPQYVVQRIVAEADRNRDGFITYREFLKMVESPQPRSLLQSSMQRYVRSFVPRQKRTVEAVDGSYEQEYTCYPPALTMIFFSVLQLVIFIYDKVKAHNTLSPNAPFFALFVYDPHRRAEVWRLLTYMFVHASETHLLVNLIVQILLGIPLEMVHRWWRIVIIYTIGVISGSLFTSVTDPTVYLAGASGGVYAILAAHIATIIMNWSEMDYPAVQLAIFLFLAVGDTANAIYYRYIAKIVTRIGYAAHFAGAIAGLLVGIYILRNLKVRRWERVLWWISFVLFSGSILVLISWNIFFPSYFPEQYPFGEKIFSFESHTS